MNYNSMQEKYKYNPFLQYNEQLETIISAKNYDADIADMLRLSFPVMIEYYGHDYKDIFFDMLKRISIEIPAENENMYDIVNRHTPKNIENRSTITAVSDGELKRASGVHLVLPVFSIVDDQIHLVNQVEIVSILRSSNKLSALANFIHELSHAFKSNKNCLTLSQNENGENVLTARNGISFVYSNVYIENGKIIIEDFQESNIGLEEGINTYDENNIINRILSLSIDIIPESCKPLKKSLILPPGKTSYISDAYRQETICADKLLNQCKLMQFIRQDQFMGTSSCEQRYNSIVTGPQNSWEILNSKLDLSLKHTYDRFKHIFDPEWYESHKVEIIENLQSIHTLLNECAHKVDKIDLTK